MADPERPAAVMTSVTHPIRVDWIDGADVPAAAGWMGKLGMTFLPGKSYPGQRGIAHARDLAMDVDRLRDEWEVDTFVLLVEDHELAWAKVEGIEDRMAARGIDLIRFPITDLQVPTDIEATEALLEAIRARLWVGQNVVVACMGGLGRTGTIVGCLLVDAGLSAQAAIDLTRRVRRGAIEMPGQERFVRAWPRQTPT